MSNVDAIIEQADKFQADMDVKNNFAVLDNAYSNDGLRGPQIEWRLGRACYQLAVEETDKAKRQPLMERALACVQSAVKEAPEDYAANKWAGIVLAKMGEFIPTKEKIANAYTIRDYFAKAVQLNPADATAHHCYGAWHWGILQIGMVERGIASMLFGSPPSTTYEECEKCLLESDKLDPQQIHNSILLGDLYYYQRKWDDAKKFYKKASECPIKTEDHKRQHEEALTKLAKC